MILKAFNASLNFAHAELRLASLATSPWLKASCYANAGDHVRTALANANAMRDRKRVASCLRILNWIRAASAANA